MSASLSRAIVLQSACALLVAGGMTATNAVRAADCLTAPNSATPANSHWYYRTDRTQQRKCWFLRAESQASNRGPVAAAGATAPDKEAQPSAAAPYSFASFKAFLAQQRGAALSDHDAEELYTEFLAWNRRAKD